MTQAPGKPPQARKLLLPAGQLGAAVERQRAAEPQVHRTGSAVGGVLRNILGSDAEIAELTRKVEDLEKALSAAEMEAAKQDGRVKNVPIARIKVIPERKRYLAPEDYNALLENLACTPLATPIVVCPLSGDPDFDYELVAGHHRTQAYTELGRATIEAFVRELPAADVETLAFVTNLYSVKLTDYEKYKRLTARMAQTGESVADLCSIFGFSDSHITQILRFGRMPNEALALLDTQPGLLSATAVRELVPLCEENRDLVIEAVKRIKAEELLPARAKSWIQATKRRQTTATGGSPVRWKIALEGNQAASLKRAATGLLLVLPEAYRTEEMEQALRAAVQAVLEKAQAGTQP